MKKFQYIVVSLDAKTRSLQKIIQEELDRHTDQGWRLVNTITQSYGSSHQTSKTVLIFEKPADEEKTAA